MPKKNINDFVRNLKRGVKKAYSKKTMTLAGRLAIAVIVERTRGRGRGVSRTGGKEKALKALSRSYIKYRKTQMLHSETSAGRSNLTLTGRLLDSMVIKKVANKFVRWGPKANKRAGSNLTNEQLAKYVAKAGRPFNYLSIKDISKISKLIDKHLQTQMNKV